MLHGVFGAIREWNIITGTLVRVVDIVIEGVHAGHSPLAVLALCMREAGRDVVLYNRWRQDVGQGLVGVIGHVGVVVTEAEFPLIVIPVIRGEFDDSRIAPAESSAVAGAERIGD
jgi:hypothetical protein